MIFYNELTERIFLLIKKILSFKLSAKKWRMKTQRRER